MRLTLKANKVAVYLTLALSVAMLMFTLLSAWYLRNQLQAEVSDHVSQLSEVITKSTRFAMLQNQPAYVDRIIHDVVSQEKIAKVRILTKDSCGSHRRTSARYSSHDTAITSDNFPLSRPTFTICVVRSTSDCEPRRFRCAVPLCANRVTSRCR